MSRSISALNQANEIHSHASNNIDSVSVDKIKSVLGKFVVDAAKLDMDPITVEAEEKIKKAAAGVVSVRTFNHLTDHIARTDVEMHISEARKVMKENFEKRICTSIYLLDGRKQKDNYPNPYALCPTEAAKAWELWDTPSTYENDAAIYDLMQRQDY